MPSAGAALAPAGLGSLLLAEEARPHVLFAPRISFSSAPSDHHHSPLSQGLLDAAESDSDSGPPFLEDRLQNTEDYGQGGGTITCSMLGKEIHKQVQLSAWLAGDLVLTHSLTLISLAYVAQLGTQPLAASALGAACYTMLGRMIIAGLCGALDTQAAQAWGAGNIEALPGILQRAVAFCLAHCLPVTALLLAVPYLLTAIGVEPTLVHLSRPYLYILIPRLWIEALNRPVYGSLLAQRIAAPQMTVTAIVIAVHIGLCHLLVFYSRLGYLGAAVAAVVASVNNLGLTVAYVATDNLASRTWGRWTGEAFKDWRRFAKLGYAACAMKCIEAWSVGGTILLATLLPYPDSAVASITVASDLYTVLSMPFIAGGMAACARVGAALGAGKALNARLAARASLLAVPIVWLILAALLLEPTSQSAILWLFTKGDDVDLVTRLRQLLQVVTVLVLFTGTQAILAGIIEGTAKQAKGAVVNLVSFYLVGLPLSVFLAFGPPQLGVRGLLGGLIAGPVVQTLCYAVLIVWRIRWKSEAFSAFNRTSLT